MERLEMYLNALETGDRSNLPLAISDFDKRTEAIVNNGGGTGGGVPVATGLYTPEDDISLNARYVFEHDAGFKPKMFAIGAYSQGVARYGLLFSVISFGNIDSDGYVTIDLGYCGYYADTGMRVESSTGTFVNLNTYPLDEQNVPIIGHSSAKLFKGVTYRWFAIGDWETN